MEFAPYVVVLWSVVALALFIRLLVSSSTAAPQLASRETLHSGRAFNALRMIALHRGRARVRLSRGEVSGPICLPSGEICIPAWAEEQLSDDELRAMLAHEFAHSVRRDPQWRVFAMALHSLLFFQPLNRVASRRLDDLAELACDGAAADLGKGRALASCLAHFARRLVAQPAPAWTAAMASSEAGIVNRVQRLVSDSAGIGGKLSWRAKTSTLGAVLALAIVTPGLALKEASSAHQGTSVEVSDDGTGYTEASMSYSNDEYKLHVEMEGRLRFNDDETDIVHMDDGDYLEISERTDDGRIKLEFYGDDRGIERSYELNGDPQPWNDEAQAHLERLLPKLFRELGLNMKARVARLLKQGGADRVIDEINLIESDYVRASYIELLAKQAQLSSSELTRVLMAAESVDSDYELRRALSAILETQELSDRLVNQVLKVGRGLDSDYEARVLLEALAPRLTGEGRDGVQAYLAMVEDISSDYEQRVALTRLMNVEGLHKDDLNRAIISARAISSDYELREVLGSAVDQMAGDPELVSAYLDTARSIGSDYEMRVAITQLLNGETLTLENLAQMLNTASDIGSDYECAQTLIDIAKVMPADQELVDVYLQSADTIDGEYERERAQRAVRDLMRGERNRNTRHEGRQEGRQEGRIERRAQAQRDARIARLERAAAIEKAEAAARLRESDGQ